MLVTVIIGSAYGDDTPTVYIVEADTNQAACEYALHVAKAHANGNGKSILYSMDGAVTFLPTIWNEDGTPRYDPPEVIDLRPPVVTRKQRWACANMSALSAQRMTKLAAGRNLLSKTVKNTVSEWRLMMPPGMTDERAVALINELSDITNLHVTFIDEDEGPKF